MRKDIKYKAILFDLFGTLVHHCPNKDFRQLMNDMSAPLGIPVENFTKDWIATSAKRAIGELTIMANLQDIAFKNNIYPTKNSYRKIVNIRKKFFTNRLTPRPETIETLKLIKQKNYKIALVSDCGEDIPALFKKTKMFKYFDTVIFSCDAKVKKPNKEIYLKALNDLNIAPEEAIFIGDGGSNELTGANNVGLLPICLKDNNIENCFRYDAQKNWHGKLIENLSQINTLI